MTQLSHRRAEPREPYYIMLVVYGVFLLYAFLAQRPSEVLLGFLRILTSPSILTTDYIAVGGLSATLVNAAVVGGASVLMLMLTGVRPNGAIIMAMWLTTGFAFFGKNVFNMIPITLGVWLFSKYSKEPFHYYSLTALLVATISPAVSEISFLGVFSRPVEIGIGVLFGVLAGFIFPPLSAGMVRHHGGYDLYNMGFTGGLLCMVVVAVLAGWGIAIAPAQIASSGNNAAVAVGLYALSAGLLCLGLFLGDVKENLSNLRVILGRSGRLVADFYLEHGYGAYLNMGLLCAFSTTAVLVMGGEFNGPAIAGVLTVMGFGSFGKHLRNILPVMAGAVIAVLAGGWNPSTANVTVILFSAGLAPIAGQYGPVWGLAAGFLHVNIASYTAHLSGGMNLYNNGFAAGFVAMFLLPLINTFRKEKGASHES